MIILINGLKGSGKDSVGDRLVKKYEFERLSFASILKDVVSAMFNWDRSALEGKTVKDREWRETPDYFWSNHLKREITPRRMLQEIGTDVIRKNFNNNFWVLSLMSRINPEVNTVITDTRFPNEVLMMNEYFSNVISLEVVRPPFPSWYGNQDLAIRQGVHSSEYSMIHYESDYTVINNRGFEELHTKIDQIMRDITK